jgi:hypothetical protein
MTTQNRQSQVLAEPHPDCEACQGERIRAERIAIANGLLRIEVMDLKTIVRRLGGERELADFLRGRVLERDILTEPTCTHGRALHAYCRRCGSVEDFNEF